MRKQNLLNGFSSTATRCEWLGDPRIEPRLKISLSGSNDTVIEERVSRMTAFAAARPHLALLRRAAFSSQGRLCRFEESDTQNSDGNNSDEIACTERNECKDRTDSRHV